MAATHPAPRPAPDPDTLAAELGLTPDELDLIRETLGREPSTAELGAYSVMWSEHASYKSSKRYLRGLPTEGPGVLVGPGENAGVVEVGEGLAVAFKIESHNHPSFVEPYQGATTGVGGIIRDVLTMGARPIALLDPLRFGDPADPVTRRVVDGVVRGIGGYGNAIGVPTVGGELSFDPVYATNPLVNVLCVGAVPADRVQLARAERTGDVAVLIGQRTGRDGIGGASVLASAEFDEDGGDDAKRPNVQVGDPFAGNLLIECCLELVDAGVLSGIQDMGAAGIICSTSEMASAAGLGMRLDLDRVPLREPSMEAWEILASESQERMLALCSPERLDDVTAICARWGVSATPIGEVTDGDRVVATHHGEVVLDAPAASIAHDAPEYERPSAPWSPPEADENPRAALTAWADSGRTLGELVWGVLTHPETAPADWVTRQYDAIVGANTIAGPGGDAAVLRLPTDRVGGGPAGRSTCGVAIAADGHGRRCYLDPERGARLVVAEAARNVACAGARPVAATNNLNFASPEEPEVMGAFIAAVGGMGAAAEALGTPITGGNVSFYNQTSERRIHPTPVVGVLGVLDDVTQAVGVTAQRAGDEVVLLGAGVEGLGQDAEALAGSVAQLVAAGRPAGRPPVVDVDAEAALHRLLADAAAEGEVASLHDVADGGLLTALVETLRGTELGARVRVPKAADRTEWLLGEPPTLVVATTRHRRALRRRAAAHGVPAVTVGEVTGARWLEVGDGFALDLDRADTVQAAALPKALGADG